MAQLWGGRFTKQTDEAVKAFNDSIGFDRRLYRQDIQGSMVHARMLGKQEIISKEDCAAITEGLQGILDDLESGTLEITADYEDIHSFVEANLIDRAGDAGKRLHTGRSRNDQVALDMRLYTRDAADSLREQILRLLEVLLDLMEKNTETFMPGFTHLQKAQPVTLAHYLGAYFEMLRRDYQRIGDCRTRMNECPLGAGALAGTTYPLDRPWVAAELGFACATRNSMDSVSDRDYLLELLSALSILMMHLSRFSEELIIWNSNEYRFVEMDDAFSTGSSIMPQKKNPDICELVRGKTGRVYGDLMSLLTTMKGLPLAYNKDMQEDKEPAFDAIDTASACVPLFAEMLRTIRFNKDVMEKSAMRGFTNATDAADYLVGKGVPFRDAHGMIGRLVLHCIDRGVGIEELSLEELREFSGFFEEDVYEAISLRACVNRRQTAGAPGDTAMREAISQERAWLKAQG
ncbi:MAG: argininosuccinate lyase [Eubacteriales bacterium]|nr:argininosuccinate lyase [Eubacteriales bacterium]